MHCFTDNVGRVWEVEINVAQAKRVRGLLGVDFYTLPDDGFTLLGKLVSSPIDLVDVLYVLCKPQADSWGVSDEDFGRALGGDSIDAATEAFLAEVVDFFPKPRVRAGLKKVLAAARALSEATEAKLEAAIDAIDLESLVRPSPTDSPASSESTPDP